MKTFKEYIFSEQMPPGGAAGGMPDMGGGMPGGMPDMGGGGMPGMPSGGMGGGMPGMPSGGMPGMPDMGGGMPGGAAGGQPPSTQPAAITAQPKNVWDALESISSQFKFNLPQKTQQKPKVPLTYLKGTPGF
jgi:hypothetical protein